MLGRSAFSISEDEAFSRKHLSPSALTHRGYDESPHFGTEQRLGKSPFFLLFTAL